MFSEDWQRFTRGWEGDIRRLQNELGGLFRDVAEQHRPSPAVDLWATDDHAVVTAEVPGLAKDDVELSVLGDALSLKHKSDDEKEAVPEGGEFLRRERRHGTFHRTVKLPFRVDAERVEATFARGILTVRLPREGTERPVKIDIGGE